MSRSSLDRGEVLAVVGENGAGKSTLDENRRRRPIARRPARFSSTASRCDFTSVAQALKHGISLIHQELNLADNLSIAANHLSRPRADALRPDRPADDRSRVAQVSGDGRPRRRPANHRQHALDRQAAARRNRQSPEHQCPAHHHGRAHLVALGARIADDCSKSCASSAPAASASSIFRIGCTKWSNWPTASSCCATASSTGELSREENQRKNMVRLMIGRDVSRFYHRTPHTPGAEVLSVRGLRTPDIPAARAELLAAGRRSRGAGRARRRRPLRAADHAVRRHAGRRRLDDRRPAAAPAANVPRSDRRRHHAGAGRSPPHRSDPADERQTKPVAGQLAARSTPRTLARVSQPDGREPRLRRR